VIEGRERLCHAKGNGDSEIAESVLGWQFGDCHPSGELVLGWQFGDCHPSEQPITVNRQPTTDNRKLAFYVAGVFVVKWMGV
jgi:hypothetical protein